MIVTPEQLKNIMGIRPSVAVAWHTNINAALELAECTTPKRAAAWLAQVGHESGCLRYTREVWGPTKQQLRYEPGTKLAKILGNIREGDGRRYMGRGLIQVTGRGNYRRTAEKMALMAPWLNNPDFEDQPDKLEQPVFSAISASIYWMDRKLNKLADSGDFTELTRRINGGYNGLGHRQSLYIHALMELNHV